MTLDRPLFFLHIPKTGGLTLRYLLNRLFAKEDICPVNGLDSFCALSDEQIAHYRFFRAHIPYCAVKLMPQTPIRITFLRNPFERTLSHYAYLKTRPDIMLSKQAIELDLLPYLRDPLVRHNQTDLMTYFISADFEPRGKRTRRKDFDLALRRLEMVEFVGITERYDESMQLLAHVLGIPPFPHVPRRNVSPERRRVSDLTPDEYAEIDRMTRLDQALYTQAVAEFDKRLTALKRETVQP